MDKNNTLTICFLGTGTSQGIPVIACDCEVCQSKDERDKRLRSSLMIEHGSHVFVIDTGPDFRQQMLRHKVDKLTAVLFTHEHKDHVAGLDDVRAFNFMLKKAIDVYAEKRVQKALRREYAYIFAPSTYPGVPRINMHTLENKPVQIAGLDFNPIRAFHHKLPVLGFRIHDFAYLTDIKTIPKKEQEKLKNLKVLVLTALRKEEHISHMNLDEALSMIEILQPETAYLIHMSHRFGKHAEQERKLPSNVRVAYDGLKIIVEF